MLQNSIGLEKREIVIVTMKFKTFLHTHYNLYNFMMFLLGKSVDFGNGMLMS